MAPYDAFLLVSFGGPEGPDDVMPFLRNVTAGRNVPDDRLAEVAEHYYQFGGVSPINAQCRELVDAIEKEFAASGIDLPVYWGNRNWQPYLADTMRAMADDGVTQAIACATSAYSSFSSCRQYLDDIDRARAAVGPGAPRVVKIPPYYRSSGLHRLVRRRRPARAGVAAGRGRGRRRTWSSPRTASPSRCRRPADRTGAPTRPSWPR